MKPLDMPMRETLFDLIYSGVRGRMTNGDTYGLWLVNDHNDTSFPMESWRHKYNVELATKAVAAMQAHGLKSSAKLDVAMGDVLHVIKHVRDLTVILVSNGEAPISGTPFDEEINARFRELASEMKGVKATVNTALIAQDGEFVAWAVNSPDFLIEVPNAPPRRKPKVEVTVSKTNVLPNAVSATAVPPLKPRIAANPIIITKESVAQERRSYVSSTATETAPTPPVEAPTNSSVKAVNAPTNAVVVAATNTTNVAIASAAAPLTNTPAIVPQAATKVEPPKTEPTNIVVAAPPVPATTSTATEVSRSGRALPWALAGACAGIAAMLALLLLLRGRRREPSLISQAIRLS